MKISAPFGTDMVSGAFGSVVFARNKGGLYVRARAVPTNPGTSFQVAQRTALAYVSQTWRDLDANDKTDWETWADNNPILDRLGNQINLSGQQAYVLVNTRKRALGDALLTEPPVETAPEPLATLSATAVDTPPLVVSLVFTRTPLAAGERLVVRAAKVNSAGISYVKNKLRLLVLEEAAASPFAVTTLLNTRLGTLTAGEIVHFDVAVASDNLLYSGSLLTSVVIV